jgi:hypothetical protein
MNNPDRALVRGWKEWAMIGRAISVYARINWISTHIAPMIFATEIFLLLDHEGDAAIELTHVTMDREETTQHREATTDYSTT